MLFQNLLIRLACHASNFLLFKTKLFFEYIINDISLETKIAKIMIDSPRDFYAIKMITYSDMIELRNDSINCKIRSLSGDGLCSR